jgi:cytoskeletal protein RodZ
MLAKNESQMDRAIRLIVGLVLLVAGTLMGGWLQIVLYILALVALLTAATGTCYLYKLLGIDTNKTKAPSEPKTEEPKTMEAVKPEESVEETEEPEAEPVKSEEEAELEVEEPAEEPAEEEVAEAEEPMEEKTPVEDVSAEASAEEEAETPETEEPKEEDKQ